MRTLKIQINCGEKTCYAIKGSPCQFVFTKHFGTQWVCGLFRSNGGADEPLLEDAPNGWLLRCPQCLAQDTTESSN